MAGNKYPEEKMLSLRKKELIISRKNSNYDGAFLQPLAVALVATVLVFLILTMGWLDIRRNETNLVGFLEDQALNTIGVLQRLTEDNLKSIIAMPDKKGSEIRTASQEEASYSKRWVIEALTEFGRKIDQDWRKGKINNNYLKKLATDNNFWYLAVLDGSGQAVYQSSYLQTDMLDESELTKNGRKLPTIEILEKIRTVKGIGFVALRRKDNSGTVVINLDKEGLLYWSLKVAVEKGIKKISEGHGIVYMQIINDQNKPLSSIGKLPAGLENNDFNIKGILSGKIRIVSRKINSGDSKILDMAAPL
jgi:hypothetical protein